MTAAAAELTRRTEAWKYKQFTLATGVKAWKGARAVMKSDGTVAPATSTTGVLGLGVFAETVDGTVLAGLLVNVNLERELDLTWWVNATAADACAVTDVGSVCYMFDDQTVSITGIGREPAGKIWAVDPLKGVLVQKLDIARGLGADFLAQPPQGVFTANDYAPATLEHDALYLAPGSAGASVNTITLPAAAPNGTRVTFVADGTTNLGTTQYRDATGLVNLTTALIAAKRHEVICVKVNGLWFANAYVSP